MDTYVTLRNKGNGYAVISNHRVELLKGETEQQAAKRFRKEYAKNFGWEIAKRPAFFAIEIAGEEKCVVDGCDNKTHGVYCDICRENSEHSPADCPDCVGDTLCLYHDWLQAGEAK